MPLSFEVIGRTICFPAGPRLYTSSETMTHGRLPACSWPRTGSRFTSHTSPRDGTKIMRLCLNHRPRSFPITCVRQVPVPTPWGCASAQHRLRCPPRVNDYDGKPQSPFLELRAGIFLL